MHSVSPTSSPRFFRGGTPPSASYYGCSQLRRSVKRSYGSEPPAFLGALSREPSLSIVVLEDNDDNDEAYSSLRHPPSSQDPSIGGGASSKDNSLPTSSSAFPCHGGTANDSDNNNTMRLQEPPNHQYKRLRLSEHSSRIRASPLAAEPNCFQGRPLERGCFVFQEKHSSY